MNGRGLMTMLRTTALSLFAGSALLAGWSGSAYAYQDKSRSGDVQQEIVPMKPRLRLRIAVDQFKWDEIRGETYSIPRDVRESLQALLIEKLRASGRFQVMEREATAIQGIKVEAQIDQQKREGLPQDVAASLTPRQRITPARFLLTPTITGFQTTRTEGDHGGFGPFHYDNRKTVLTLSLNIRIADAETSALLETATAEGKQEIKGGGVSIEWGRDWKRVKMGKKNEKTTPLSQVVEAALDSAVTKIVNRLNREPWSALVAGQDPTTGRVILNVGTDSGLETGMEFDVYKAGGPVRDPLTKDIISQGGDEVKIGRIRVVRLEAGVAFCDILDGKTFEANNIVRLN